MQSRKGPREVSSAGRVHVTYPEEEGPTGGIQSKKGPRDVSREGRAHGWYPEQEGTMRGIP
eukprot:jgi/Botrbrau1/5246/Bobra.0172s0108.1